MTIEHELRHIKRLLDSTEGLNLFVAEETHRLCYRLAQLRFAVWLCEEPTKPTPKYDLVELTQASRPFRLAVESIAIELMGGHGPELEAALAELTAEERLEYEVARRGERKRFEGVKTC